MRMRLFAAVWPPQEVLDHLDLTLASVRGGPAGRSSAVRWSARETWHLTTSFYGEVPDGLVPTLVETLREACVELAPYELALRGAGVFSHRTLWVGAAGGLPEHRALTGRCREAGAALGLHDDGRVGADHYHRSGVVVALMAGEGHASAIAALGEELGAEHDA